MLRLFPFLLPLRWFALTFAFLCMMAQATLAYQPPQNPRGKYNFNSNWRVTVGDMAGAEATNFNDSAWKQVSTPYAWNEDEAFKVSIEQLPTGIAWYRKHFKLPVSATSKKVFLEFEGIRHAGEFYLNGEWIGRSENGVMAFGFDITGKVKPAPQENVLAAKIDNSWSYREKATNSTFQWNDRNFYANYGGINKNVFLHVTDRLYQTLPLYSNLGTTGVYVYPGNIDITTKSADVVCESQVKNEYSTPRTVGYQVVIEDMTGKVVKTIDGTPVTIRPGQTQTLSARSRVAGLNFWSWGYGYIYNVYTVLKVGNTSIDVVKTRTGFRKTGFTGGALKLNDRTIQLKGYAQRTTNEWPAVGLSVPAWMSDFSNRLMVESNANLVRWMHVTPWKQDVESCDRVGLIQALPAGDSERDPDGRRWELRTEVMRDAIIYNRNNPSVIFYECGNNGISEEHMAQMKAIRDKYDPHGGRAIGSRNMQGSQIAEYGGEMLYINKSATKPMWAMEYSRDEGLRKYWDDFSPPFHRDGDGPPHKGEPAAGYNRNQDSHAIEDVARWYDYWRERPGTGKRVNAGGVNIVFSDSNTHHRGESNYRTSGEVDAMRLPKDGFFAHQVMWDGWVDAEHPRAHLLGHWNYAPGTTKDITVVSSAPKVELFVNGVSQGFGTRSQQFLFTFKNVVWQAGKIRAVGTDAAGKSVCSDERETTGPPVALRLASHTNAKGLLANGSDLALVDVEVVDAQGRRCPTALNIVQFALTGPAQWRGGIAQGPDNYIMASALPVEGGINRVILRSTTQAGRITLTAKSEGLSAASLSLSSRAVPAPVSQGVSPLLPDAELPSFLGRGPTPAGDSIIPTRTPLEVASVRAGANSEKAAATSDDNEATSWSNDGSLETAWIEYHLSRPAQMSEVTLKLGNWRSKSYPVRILVDEKVVFSGATPQSLGYVTLTFPATLGQNLKIQLAQNAKNRDAFGGITELSDPKNAADSGTTSNAKGTLNIVETEIYGP